AKSAMSTCETASSWPTITCFTCFISAEKTSRNAAQRRRTDSTSSSVAVRSGSGGRCAVSATLASTRLVLFVVVRRVAARSALGLEQARGVIIFLRGLLLRAGGGRRRGRWLRLPGGGGLFAGDVDRGLQVVFRGFV